MANPADLDPSTSVPCKRCAALLQAGEQVCPFCGEVQATRAAEDASAEGDMDFADTVQPEDLQDVDKPPAHAGTEVDSEIGMVRPGAIWPKEESPSRGKGLWAGSFAVPKRLAIGIVAACVLIALGLMLGRSRLDTHDEAATVQGFKAQVEQAQSALSRGDLGSAAQLLDVLDAGHADDPGVQNLRTTLDQRLQERVKRQQLLDAALKASRALRLDEVPAPTAEAPAPAPAPPQAPITAAPAPASGVTPADDKECSEALSALALCARK